MANQTSSQQQIQELARRQAQFMAKVWSNPQFKQRLISDPTRVMRGQGMPVAEAVESRIVENTTRFSPWRRRRHPRTRSAMSNLTL